MDFLKDNIDWIYTTLLTIGLVLGAVVWLWGRFPFKVIKKTNQVKRIQKTSNFSLASKSGKVSFDYSTNNGLVVLGEKDIKFGAKFSKASDSTIHVYNDHSTISKVLRVKNLKSGDIININDFDNSSRSYTIGVGELFILENHNGYFLQGRLESIKDDRRGDDRDEVCFDYQILDSQNTVFKAI